MGGVGGVMTQGGDIPTLDRQIETERVVTVGDVEDGTGDIGNRLQGVGIGDTDL